ncbi:hypothetical protein L1049_016917 [Liquidambar formosana]|uniref:Glutaredoxin domain-containing protein n=1 Tax=Liquidambar formosana TaxID=63359 RepID=A0AAP0X7V0_LIQFO
MLQVSKDVDLGSTKNWVVKSGFGGIRSMEAKKMLLQMEEVTKLISQRPLVIFSKSDCCMCYSIETLFRGFGANSAIHEVDQIPRGQEIEEALSSLGCNPTVPVVFIGGELGGGAGEVISLHLKRSLIPWLKRVKALWV